MIEVSPPPLIKWNMAKRALSESSEGRKDERRAGPSCPLHGFLILWWCWLKIRICQTRLLFLGAKPNSWYMFLSHGEMYQGDEQGRDMGKVVMVRDCIPLPDPDTKLSWNNNQVTRHNKTLDFFILFSPLHFSSSSPVVCGCVCLYEGENWIERKI